MTRKIKVLSDGWIFRYQRWGGINVYFRALMKYSCESVEWTLGFKERFDSEVDFPHATRIKYLSRLKKPSFLSHQLKLRDWKTWERRFCDLHHPTYFDWLSCVDPSQIKKPVVCTVHDCIHERFPEHQKLDPTAIHAKKKMIQRADKIICITQNTADDLDHFYPGHSDKIRIILSGTDFRPPPLERATKDYFAFVGTRPGYKNFASVVSAAAIFREHYPDIKIKISGTAPQPEELQLIKNQKLEDVFDWVGFLPEEQLPTFYFNSIALLFPSLYEGFGLPAIDAMASGTTVIAHAGSSFPEVVSSGGIMVDTQKPEFLADAMMSLMEDSFRSNLLNSARQQAASMPWSKTAEQVTKLYQSLVS